MTSPSPPQRAAASLAVGQISSTEDLVALRSYLGGSLHRRFQLDRDDVWDIVDESILKFLQAGRARALRPVDALGYLRRVAYNECVDRLRRNRPLPTSMVAEELASDDIARFLSAHADAVQIEHLMARLAQRGDAVATQVLNVFLTLAEDLGRAPSSREVAARCDVSHVTVQNVLSRCRHELIADATQS